MQIWSQITNLGQDQTGTVTTTPIRLFEAAGVSANSVRQGVFIHNSGLSGSADIWVRVRKKNQAVGTFTQAVKNHVVSPGESRFFDLSDVIDAWIVAASGSQTYVAWEVL